MFGFDWDAELTDERRDSLIERLAEIVHRRGLHAPAILLLELQKPFAFLSGQAVVLGSGFLAPLFGPSQVRDAARLMESRDNIERLICRIESLAAAKETPA
jgi:hypothetical protein